MFISHIFGNSDRHLNDFQDISYHPFVTSWGGDNSAAYRNSFLSGLNRAESILESMISEIETLWDTTEHEAATMNEIENYRPDDNGPQTPQINMKIFISHSSKDSTLAALLINLLRKALNLSSNDILCTSVTGYGLPGGVSTNDTLRSEVFGAELVVGLITPNSLKSAYVAFELGARWGINKPMLPLLAAGASHADLEGPLEEINTLSSYSSAEVFELVEQIAHQLNVQLEKISSFTEEIDQMVSLSSNTKETDSDAKISVINLWSDIASNINYLTESNSHLLEPKHITTLKSRLKKLRELGIIENDLGGLLLDMHAVRNAITHGKDAYIHPHNLSHFVNAAKSLDSIVSSQKQKDQHVS